ncbi:exocyst complex component 3-like protein 4 isoform X2 [Channa argus]|uniref:exocyst complex component 3-like protein 4 isoform X2 n=2 Tax=Channa argus TaxID=215402 RepID=UPI0035229902
MMDESVENPDVDRVSLKSKTPTKDAIKETLGTLRQRFRGVTNGPFSSLRKKRPKTSSEEAPASDDSGSPNSPLSPSLDSAMSRLRSTIRRGSNKPKIKHKSSTNDESSSEEKNSEDDEQEANQEMPETYTLPEIPHTPLSVMQINKLIETALLEEAHVNLLALRQEFQREQEQCGEDSTMELAKKEKDINLLYEELRNKVMAIVCDSDKEVPVPVARIIQEEEKRAEEPGGLAGSWMEAWREAVVKRVQVKVDSVPLDSKEQSSSWLAVYLGHLGKAIVEDLGSVKSVVRWCYPPSFRVFSTYVKGYHTVVGQHLKQLEEQVTELRDLYALLDWIINKYKSDRIMGSESLQPDMKDESTDLQLEESFLKQLQEKYCCRVKEDISASLDRVIELENEETWRNSKPPQKEDTFLDSQFHMDIWTKVKGLAVNSGKINAPLEQMVLSVSLQELTNFPKRFESEFKRHCGAVEPQSLWIQYHITYINSFAALQEHMEGYKDTCPGEVEGFRREVKCLIVRLVQVLEDQFKEDVKPYLRGMMVRKWLRSDADFNQLYSHTAQLSQHCSVMRPPHAQDVANRLHYHVVKEYVGQLMKNNYSCKNRKHEKAATKIRQQLGKLANLFEDMKSTQDWLYPVGDDLSDIIGQKNKTNIKEHLEPLVKHYPDFSRRHLVAVMNFRGLLRGQEHQLILQRLTELKKKLDGGSIDKSRVLFDDMQVTTNTDCLSVVPLPCLRNLLPDH